MDSIAQESIPSLQFVCKSLDIFLVKLYAHYLCNEKPYSYFTVDYSLSFEYSNQTPRTAVCTESYYLAHFVDLALRANFRSCESINQYKPSS